MKIGLCNFKTQDLNEFLYKKTDSFADTLKVFFHRVVYFVPTGFTWINTDRVVTLLHANNKDDFLVETFKAVKMNETVSQKVNDIGISVLNLKVDKVVKKIIELTDNENIARGYDPGNDYIRAIQLAFKPKLSVEEKDFLSRIKIDENLDQFILKQTHLYKEIIALAKHACDVEFKNTLVGLDINRINEAINEKYASLYKHYVVVAPYADLILINEHLDSKAKEILMHFINKRSIREWARDRDLYELSDVAAKLIDICEKWIIEEIKTLNPTNGILSQVKQSIDQGQSLDEYLQLELIDFLAKEGPLSRVSTNENHQALLLNRKKEIIRSLAKLPKALYELDKENLAVKILLLAFKEELSEKEMKDLLEFPTKFIKESLSELEPKLLIADKLLKLGLLNQTNLSPFLNLDLYAIQNRFHGLISNTFSIQMAELQIWAPLYNGEINLTHDEALLVQNASKQLPNLVDEWVKNAEEPTKLKETLLSVVKKINAFYEPKIHNRRELVNRNQPSESSFDGLQIKSAQNKQFLLIIKSCLNKKLDDYQRKIIIESLKDPHFETKLNQFKVAIEKAYKLDQEGYNGKDILDELVSTPVNEMDSKIEKFKLTTQNKVN